MCYCTPPVLRFVAGHVADDIGVTSINDAQNGCAEILAASSAELDIVASVVVNRRAANEGVVFNLRLADRRAVVGKNDQLSLARTQSLQCGLVAHGVLATLHDEGETRVDALLGLLLLLDGDHDVMR